MEPSFFLKEFFFPLLLAFFAAAAGFLASRADWIRRTASDEIANARSEASREAAEKFDAYQAETDRKFQRELEHIKTNLGLQSSVALERQRIALNNDDARSRFLQNELNRSADPILQAATDLRFRLENILQNRGWYWLSRPEKTDSDFYKTATYFRSSTLYVFCRYFCYVELLNERLGYLFEERGDERQEFTDLLRKASGVLGSHNETATGAQIFHWQQRALGEVMTVTTDGGERCMRYAAFIDHLQSEGFAGHISPLDGVLDDLEKDKPSWQRLEAFATALTQIEAQCRTMLQLPPVRMATDGQKQTVLPNRPSLDHPSPKRPLFSDPA
jgi:hypothetical protein